MNKCNKIGGEDSNLIRGPSTNFLCLPEWLEEAIIRMYQGGMGTREIAISNITHTLMEDVHAWLECQTSVKMSP